MGKRRNNLARALEQEIRFLSDLGADFIFAPEPRGESSKPLSKEQKDVILQAVEERVLRCTLCALSAGRTNAVPGEGCSEMGLMFVGEAPGGDEDLQGRPFVGRAGQMLTRIIEAMRFRREEVYITNVIKCRPPQNRTPLREEVEKCKPYLLTQIEVIAPKIIVSLGKVATDFFRPSAAPISLLRGNFFEYGKTLVMPTFHPSFLLRNEGDKKFKKLVWEDMQKVMAVLGKK
ncbi:MAG: uracil-DNA glycosylase [Acidobacteriota bacterium]